MMDTNILDMLDDIGRSSVARLSPGVTISGDTAQMRREKILRAIRGTILPRRLEFTAANGDCLAIEVNSSRVTDVFRVRSGVAPDFETETRAVLAEKLAQLVSDIASAPAPLVLISLQPDAGLEADDVGVTFNEIANACENIELLAEPVISVVSDTPDPVEETTPDSTLASTFFDGAEKFALGRVHTHCDGNDAPRLDGECQQGKPLCPDQDLLGQLARDLAGWDDDAATGLGHPQLIVMRPSGGKGDAVAILHDGDQFTLTVHEARKLGAVVNLWTALSGSGG
ncbi:hypothetical protein [Ruegeria halocynthiae]|uniref:hypothetical protein n=1 Tax=Ruegeria halocynthiae TaxID=985054 RepID=UPI000569ACA1|nr:hypothetical protein [Ruegeria halocynthiae]